uniref:Ankyrin repeat protein n=1 Tax=viral metagenome TaxID=1070528 RepID=A0A6C0JTF7_9ZZZZ
MTTGDFYYYCRLGNLNEIKNYVENHCITSEILQEGLHIVCYDGKLEIVEYLINHVDTIPMKCLFWCYSAYSNTDEKCCKILELLLDHGKFVKQFNLKDICFYNDVTPYFRERARELITNYLYGLDSQLYNENIF